ncbi:MAG: type IV secretion system protein [Hyphomicrobiaceae bacterium]
MKIQAIIMASILTGATPALSAGVPTIDATSVAQLQQMIAEAKLQLKEQITQNLKLDQQIVQLVAQLEEARNIYAALKDGLSLEDLGINADFLDNLFPELSDIGSMVKAANSGEWDSMLDGSIGGGSVANYVTDIFASAGVEKETFDTLSKSDNPERARIGTQANQGAFLSVAAEASAEDAKESLERVDDLVQKIPDTANLKAAIDLNTRVTAELAIALANVWSMEAAQTIGMGQAGVMDAATLAAEEKFLDLSGE